MTTAPFRIDFDETSLAKTASGLITGRVALAFGSHFRFPEQEWSDFPYVIAGWWLKAVAAAGNSEVISLDFMDGPAKCEMLGGDELVVECLFDDVPDGQIANAGMRVLRTEVVDACNAFARNLVDIAGELRLDTADVGELSSLVRATSHETRG